MNILITGGTSFIASHLITKLINDSEINKIYVVTRRINNFIEKISLFEKIEIIELVFEEYAKYFKSANLRIDVVYHFSWSGVRGNLRNDKVLQKHNYELSIRFIKKLIKNNADIMIFLAGSQSEYGNVDSIELINEAFIPINTVEEYGIYKKRVYDELNELNEKYNFTLYNCRYISLFGTGDYDKSLVSITIDNFQKGSVLNLKSDCENYWNYLYIKDAVDALVLMMKKRVDSGIYNFCSNEIKTLREYIEDIKVALDSDSIIVFGSERSNVNLNYSNSKLVTSIDWSPKYTFIEGIKDMINKK